MIRRRRSEGADASLPRNEVARWPMPDGGFLIEAREVVPRRWWNRLTRPIGIALIVGAVGWPVVVMWHGWPRLALAFAIAGGCVIVGGCDLMRWGQSAGRRRMRIVGAHPLQASRCTRAVQDGSVSVPRSAGASDTGRKR